MCSPNPLHSQNHVNLHVRPVTSPPPPALASHSPSQYEYQRHPCQKRTDKLQSQISPDSKRFYSRMWFFSSRRRARAPTEYRDSSLLSRHPTCSCAALWSSLLTFRYFDDDGRRPLLRHHSYPSFEPLRPLAISIRKTRRPFPRSRMTRDLCAYSTDWDPEVCGGQSLCRSCAS